jgi:predicted nucleic acid-binding protein
MPYLLDANVFIDAEQKYYALDVVVAFWDWMVTENQKGNLFSHQQVLAELLKGNDDLAKWAKKRGKKFFLPIDDDTNKEARVVNKWVNSRSFDPDAKRDFFRVADFFLIACAKAHGFTLVTHETYEPNRVNRVKIPNVCRGVGVQYCNTFQMLKREGVVFRL